jgi:hypothetical protein
MDSSHHERPQSGRLLARVHAVSRARHLSLRTEEAYRSWIVRFVRFNETRHPAGLGEREVRSFLEWLAAEGKVAASTLNQAHAALPFCTATCWVTLRGARRPFRMRAPLSGRRTR